MEFLINSGVFFLFIVLIVYFVANGYKVCPQDSVIVVYNKASNSESPKWFMGGVVFVMPLLQGFTVLSLKPMTIFVKLNDIKTREDVKIDASFTFSFEISTKYSMMQNAVKSFLNCDKAQIISTASDVITYKMKLLIPRLTIEEINNNEEFLEKIYSDVNLELNAFGLEVINVIIKKIATKTNNETKQTLINQKDDENEIQMPSCEEQNNAIEEVSKTSADECNDSIAFEDEEVIDLSDVEGN